jgi:hypothetical protein
MMPKKSRERLRFELPDKIETNPNFKPKQAIKIPKSLRNDY